MEITIDCGELRTAVADAAKAIAAKSAMPIMSCVLLRMTGAHEMEVSAGNEDMTVTRTAHVIEGGDCALCVNAKTLSDALKNIPVRPITATLEKEAVTFDYGNGKFTVPTQNADDWPEDRKIDDDAVEVTASVADMSDGLSRTSGCISANDVIHPVMSGVYMEAEGGRLTFSATDGHQLCRCVYRTPYEGEKRGMIIPGKAVSLLKSALADGDEVTVTVGARAAEFLAGDYRLRTALISGRYPNVNSVIPLTWSVTAVIDREALTAAIRRVMPMAGASVGLVRMGFSRTGELYLRAQDIDYSLSAEEAMQCESCTGDVRVGLKGGFLSGLLSQTLAGSERVTFGLTDETRAVVMKPAEAMDGRDVTALLMPMVLND